ncbi:hypothetical protein C7I87_06770 [Mesorhizobium sp. SARCC-RB16n]|uniref:Sec-independent protein translocase subunit TatA/TatB n=1 Tax=Mesorhizobium sp. SARCC-RB16n TaxID=2116687 RepID=UPI00122F5660|nr:twin-arginine translocase TatA/TatE family subunit [Mesorhizobium sp. SARCC-RB16n]KAA3451465.1 hypothetical protein C7I87_06770 [Mesorhizobium sp. SARCC-RB16n]
MISLLGGMPPRVVGRITHNMVLFHCQNGREAAVTRQPVLLCGVPDIRLEATVNGIATAHTGMVRAGRYDSTLRSLDRGDQAGLPRMSSKAPWEILMFGLGWDHLVVIFVVALVVFGPGELPNVMRSLGTTMKTVNRYLGDFRRQFDDAMREAEKELDLEEARSKHQEAASSVPQDTGGAAIAKEIGQDGRTAAS